MFGMFKTRRRGADMTSNEFGAYLLEAVGLDSENVHRIEIDIHAGRLATMRVTYQVPDSARQRFEKWGQLYQVVKLEQSKK